MRINTISIISLIMAIMMFPLWAQADNKNKKKKQPIVYEEPDEFQVKDRDRSRNSNGHGGNEQNVRVSDLSKQIKGEWNVVEIDDHPIKFPRGKRAYLWFDFDAMMIYGNTGVNDINATFNYDNSKIKAGKLIKTNKYDDNSSLYNFDRQLQQVLDGGQLSVSLFNSNGIEYMELKGKHKIRLRRQNLDFLNGEWIVKRVYDNDLNLKSDFILVNDVNAKTVNIFTKGNVIYGEIFIDPTVEYGIEYENFISTRNQWENINDETRLLIALEETLYCRRVNDREVILYTKVHQGHGRRNGDGEKVLVVLQRSRNY